VVATSGDKGSQHTPPKTYGVKQGLGNQGRILVIIPDTLAIDKEIQ